MGKSIIDGADIRSFFGGGGPKKPAAPASTAVAAKPVAGAGSAAVKDNEKEKPKEKLNDKEEKAKEKAQEKPKAKSDKVDSGSDSKKSSVEGKSPHFSDGKKEKEGEKPKTVAITSNTSTTIKDKDKDKKSKKRIRDEEEEDEDEVMIVDPKPSAASSSSSPSAVPAPASPAKQVVIRHEASPHKKASKASGPTSASAFFGSATSGSTDDASKLKARVEAVQKENEKKKIRKEIEEQQAALKRVEEEERKQQEEQAAKEQADLDAAIAASKAEAEAKSKAETNPAMEDISANWEKIEQPDAKMSDVEDVKEIPKPTPVKSPLKSNASAAPAKSPAKSPIANKAKVEADTPMSPPAKAAKPEPVPSASPLKNSSLFTPFSPSELPRPSLSAHPHVAPSPKKPSASPAKSPTPASSINKRSHIETVDSPPPASAVASNSMTGFGGSAVDPSDAVEESPMKKQKANDATAVPTSAAKKWYPNKPQAAPVKLGSKEAPVGKPDCLANLTFVLTGVGEAFTREDLQDIIKKYGGKCTTSVSKKTNYLVAGAEAGESKTAKAKELGTKIVDEDFVLQLIRDKSKGWNPPSTSSTSTAASSSSSPSVAALSAASKLPAPKPLTMSGAGPAIPLAPKGSAAEQAVLKSGVQSASSVDEMLWVDRHRPLKVESIIGNPGLVKQVTEWLQTWHEKRKERAATMTAKEQEKVTQKALLITGPPGIGKTTAATVIARNLGFEVIEFNASDTRNKKSLELVVGDITGNRGLTEFYTAGKPQTVVKPKPNVIIMDEVDGLAGNEDRGGLQELVSLIKKTKTPMICIANDATTPKMRTLKNYTTNITWRRVPAASIAPHIQKICEKEGLKIDRQSIEKIAESTQGDIRQILNFLQMFRNNSPNVTFDEVKARIDASGKDFDLGPFDVVPNFFKTIPQVAPGRKNDWIGERQNMYFVDSDIIPLFIQENYLHAKPMIVGLSDLKKNEKLSKSVRSNQLPLQAMNDVLSMEQVAEAADSISLGDVVSDSMYTEQDYTLMPSHAVLSTIYPSYLMRAGLAGRVEFPQWLGKQSTAGKFQRIAKEFKTALTIDIHADTKDTVLHVLPTLRQELVKALADDADNGVEYVVEQLDHLGLDKEDFDLLMEWGEKFQPESQRYAQAVPANIKRKLTTAWNDGVHMRKVSRGSKADAGAVSKVRGGAAFKTTTDDADDDEEEDEEAEGEEEKEGSDAAAAAAAAVASKPSKPKAGGKKAAASSSAAAGGAAKKPRAPRKPKAASKKKSKDDDDEDDDDDF